MNDINDTSKDLFAGWSPTEPPRQVRERVLAAARRGAVPARRPLEDRLWENRLLRIGWLTAAALLLALNLWLPTPVERDPRGSIVAGMPVDFDPLLASLIEGHPPTRTTWADQRQLVPVLLEEGCTVATDATDAAADGGKS
jgi:hypothetical protein